MEKMDSIEVLRADQIAKLLNVKTDTVYKWCARGLIPHYKVEKCVRLKLNDVQSFLEDRRIVTARPPKPEKSK